MGGETGRVKIIGLIAEVGKGPGLGRTHSVEGKKH